MDKFKKILIKILICLGVVVGLFYLYLLFTRG